MNTKDRFKGFGDTRVPLAQLLEEAAARYTKAGWYVFPVSKKSPLTEHGHLDASLDYKKFNWEPPCSGVAIATGPSKLVVVDADSVAANDEYLQMVEGETPCGTVVKTSRGWQYYYADPEGTFTSRNAWRTNLDIKAQGGYVVAPCGVSGGKHRTWLHASKPVPPPEKLAGLLPKRTDTATAPPPGSRPDLPILERHGWTYVGASGTNLYYRKPGKTEGKQAEWNGHVLVVFTPNAPPLEEKPYSYKQLVQVLEGPKSEWRKSRLEALWEDQDIEAFFETLGGASAYLQDKYRDLWKSSKKGLKAFDNMLKEAQKEFRELAEDREQEGPIMQKDYPALLIGIGREVRLNECNQDIEINKEYWDDRSWHVLMHDAKIWAQERGQSVYGESMLNALYAVASANSYNPLKQYLEGLDVAEGTKEMDKLISCFHPAEGDGDGVRARIRAWLVGCVARVYEPSYQNPMLVLQGPQNTGKSFFAGWLCSDLKAYAHNAAIDPDCKDCELMQSRAWIWEVEELEATTNKRSVAKLKAFLTKARTRLRAPYGKRDMVRTTIANYLGTVNRREFLSDETGNRRFLVCFLDNIDWSYSGEGLGGGEDEEYHPARATKPGLVWAEALALYREGGWHLTREEKAEAEKSASDALDTSDVDAWVWQVVELTDNALDVAWLDDIARELRNQGVKVSSADRLRKGICNVLKKEGRVGVRKTRSRTDGGSGGKNKKRMFWGVKLISGMYFGEPR